MKTLEYYKEVAATAAYIVWADLLYGTYFNTFDTAYELAEEFLEEYPLDVAWGMEEGLEWDETVERFVNARYVNGKKL